MNIATHKDISMRAFMTHSRAILQTSRSKKSLDLKKIDLTKAYSDQYSSPKNVQLSRSRTALVGKIEPLAEGRTQQSFSYYAEKGSRFMTTAIAVVCGLGKHRILARFLMADYTSLCGIRENIGGLL